MSRQRTAKTVPAPATSLELRLVPLATAKRWDRNPKRHDLAAIADSIRRYGFKDPPKWEPALGGIVEGNGRLSALEQMRAKGEAPPRGVGEDESGGWLVPVLFGVDAASRAEAEAYGIDHNNITLAGSPLGSKGMAALWDEESYLAMVEDLLSSAAAPESFGEAELRAVTDAGGEWLDGDDEVASINDLMGARRDGQHIRPVVAIDDVATIERALLATHEPNRGRALALVCRGYLDAQGLP